jgi:peptide/nickel transport system substrate-binding protein
VVRQVLPREQGGEEMPQRRVLTRVTLAVAVALALSSCSDTDAGEVSTSAAGPEPGIGGTLRWLNPRDDLAHLDPQRISDQETIAFATGFLFRPLTGYSRAEDPSQGNRIVGDLATDAGTPNRDATQWSFTLRRGVTFEDGSRVTCEDVRYGVSRSFDRDVITGGPPYAISFLDIPPDPAGGSAYKGPYDGTGQALFDRAVRCDGRTITFALDRSVADFNATTTLPLFSPVPAEKDTRRRYDRSPVATGPYRVARYDRGTALVLRRNEAWRPRHDSLRPAFPDVVEVTFGVDPDAVSRGVVNDEPGYESVVTTVPIAVAPTGGDPDLDSAAAAVASRASSELSGFVYYIAIDTEAVPVPEHRQALQAALDRGAVVEALGGPEAADAADGVLTPNQALDYRPTSLWDEALGKPVGEAGDPELAGSLIARADASLPQLSVAFPSSRAEREAVVSLIDSAALAGIDIEPVEISTDAYYETVLREPPAPLVFAAWRPDWSNGSRTIPAMFSERGGFNLSRYDRPRLQRDIDQALRTVDRDRQGRRWAAINQTAVEEGLVVPLAFLRDQRVWGSAVRNVFHWAPYGTFSWGDLAAVPAALPDAAVETPTESPAESPTESSTDDSANGSADKSDG